MTEKNDDRQSILLRYRLAKREVEKEKAFLKEDEEEFHRIYWTKRPSEHELKICDELRFTTIPQDYKRLAAAEKEFNEVAAQMKELGINDPDEPDRSEQEGWLSFMKKAFGMSGPDR